jgi:hypothetical protein
MSANELVELPAKNLTYRFTSLHRVVGVSGLADVQDVEIAAGEENARILLTTEPARILAAADLSAARQFLAIKQLILREAAQRSAEEEAAEIARERIAKFGEGVYLIVEATGVATASQPSAARGYDWGWVAIDAVDKDQLAASHKPLVDRAVGSLAAMDIHTCDVAKVREVIELYLPDGRALQSVTVTGGSARLSAARPFTDADKSAVEGRVAAIQRNPKLATPIRLLAQAVRSQDDHLEAFLYAWGAMETLVNPSVAPLECESGEWIAQVPTKDHEAASAIHAEWKTSGHRGYSLGQRLAVFALVHGSGPSSELVAEFSRLNGAYRGPLAHHGDIPPPDASDTVIGLVRKLLRVAVG